MYKKWRQVKKSLAGIVLATVLLANGCGGQHGQDNLEPSKFDQIENQNPTEETDTDLSRDKTDLEQKEHTEEPEKTEDSENGNDLGNIGEPESTEQTENPKEEGQSEIERIGEQESYEAEDGTQLFISALYYPSVSMPQTPDIAKKINAVFEEQMAADEELIKEYQELAASDYEQLQEQEDLFFLNYALDRDYVVTCSGERLLSMNEVIYSYAGGAHPSSQVQGWNFDLVTGEQVTWEQMTDEIDRFREFLLGKMDNFFETEQLSDGTFWKEGLYPDYKEMLPGLLETPTWYIEGENLVLIFNPYEIAPYAAGIIAVNIPLKDCEDYWNGYGWELLQNQNNS